MNLKQLPLEIENIIKDYYYQLELTEKYDKCMRELSDTVKHEEIVDGSKITTKRKERLYLCNLSVVGLQMDSSWLRCDSTLLNLTEEQKSYPTWHPKHPKKTTFIIQHSDGMISMAYT